MKGAVRSAVIDPFQLVTRGRVEIAQKSGHSVSPILFHDESETDPQHWNAKTFLLRQLRRDRAEQLLLVDDAATLLGVHAQVAEPATFYSIVSPPTGMFPDYLRSMLVLFVNSALNRQKGPPGGSVEGRLERLERALLEKMGIDIETEKPRVVDWAALETAMASAAEALGWKAEWTIDRDAEHVTVRVAEADYRRMAHQRFDFYEQIAASVDKGTFKAVSFDFELAE